MTTETIQSITHDPQATTVRLRGEIDMHRSPQLHEALVELCAALPKRLIVDLSKVNYIDSSGIGSLVEIFRRLNRAGSKMVLVAPSPGVRSLLEITRLDRFFVIAPDHDQAVRA